MKKSIRLLALLAILFCSLTIVAQTKVTFYTTKGNFVADLYDTLQPITTGNFKSLVNQKFYDGIIFHRVINGFVIQGGDPTGTGNGGPGYTIPDEFDPLASNLQRTLGMANDGPNTGGSQFYINLVNNTYLNPNYPVFGRVVLADFPVVQSIGIVATDTNDRPLIDVVMDSVRITAFPTGLSTVNSAKNSLLVEVWPNPIQTNSTLQLQTNESQTVKMCLLNFLGQTIMQQQLNLSKGITSLSMSSLFPLNFAKGNYVLLIQHKDAVQSYKISL